MPINAHPEYLAAEKEHLSAKTPEEKLKTLENMISLAPKHKGAENLRAQLKTKRKKLLEQINKSKKAGKFSKAGIKKHEMQAVIVGKTNSGKSSLLASLTNAKPKISESNFTTKEPVIGMMPYLRTNMQLIEIPAIESEYYDRGLTNSADVLLIIVDKIEEIKEIEESTPKVQGKKIILFNKVDLLDEKEKRKIFSTLQSKKYDFVLISTKTGENIEELKEKIFKSFDKIRIYTKEPGKEKTQIPIILKQGSEVKDVAEKILHGFSNQIKETRITGPSSKFPNQKVGLNHKLKDLDVVEFKTR